MFPNLWCAEECANRAIVTPHAHTAKLLNDKILQRLNGRSRLYQSSNRLGDGGRYDDVDMASDEWLNSQEVTGVPAVQLNLKVGAVCLLMRNLDRSSGMMNNAKVIVKAMSDRCVFVKRFGAPDSEKPVPIPRIKTRFKVRGTELYVERRQFPLQLGYAVTVNRAQGQTYEKVGIDVRADFFSHGQLYVALGRAKSSKDITILAQEKRMHDGVAMVQTTFWQELLAKKRFLTPSRGYSYSQGDEFLVEGSSDEDPDIFGTEFDLSENANVGPQWEAADQLLSVLRKKGDGLKGPISLNEDHDKTKSSSDDGSSSSTGLFGPNDCDNTSDEEDIGKGLFGPGSETTDEETFSNDGTNSHTLDVCKNCSLCDGDHETQECSFYSSRGTASAAIYKIFRQRMTHRRKNEAWQVIECPKDGTCMFHAISFHLYQEFDGETFRETLVNEICSNPNMEINGCSLEDIIEFEFDETIDEYVTEMTGGRWGGAMDLLILHKALNLDFQVFIEEDDGFQCVWSTGQTKLDNQKIRLLYNGHTHYDLLLSDEKIVHAF